MRLKGLLTLKNKKDFHHNKSTGITIFSKNLVMQISQADNNAINIGFVVSKKVGKAVKRNLIKRRLRSIAEQFLTRYLTNRTYVIIAKKNSSLVSFADLKKDFFYCLKKYYNFSNIS